VVLATALGIVLTKKKAETIARIDQDFYNSIYKIFAGNEKVKTLNEFKEKIAPMGIKKVDSDVVVLYYYRPPDSGKLEENISQVLSPKIKKFFDSYKRDESIQKLICSIRIPYEDSYGNKDWMPVLSFEFDKETYKNINWKKFEETELFKYAQNIQWHDMTT
jgi:hypothetical protein